MSSSKPNAKFMKYTADTSSDSADVGEMIREGPLAWFSGFDRRAHRRHDLEGRDISVMRIEASAKKQPSGTAKQPAGTAKAPAKKVVAKSSGKAEPRVLGRLVDLSAGGVRLRTTDKTASVGTTLNVKIELPAFAGISPFVEHSGTQMRPKREWTGKMTVVRVRDMGDFCELGCRLEDLDELDRGMLSLYLSTQPLAA